MISIRVAERKRTTSSVWAGRAVSSTGKLLAAVIVANRATNDAQKRRERVFGSTFRDAICATHETRPRGSVSLSAIKPGQRAMRVNSRFSLSRSPSETRSRRVVAIANPLESVARFTVIRLPRPMTQPNGNWKPGSVSPRLLLPNLTFRPPTRCRLRNFASRESLDLESRLDRSESSRHSGPRSPQNESRASDEPRRSPLRIPLRPRISLFSLPLTLAR